MSSKFSTLIQAAEADFMLLFHKLPDVVKTYESQGLHICEQIKAALASPEAGIIEQVLATMIPGNWETTVVEDVTKALGIAIPLITNQQAHSQGTVIENAAALVDYLKTLSPKMQHAGLLKLLSGLFQALDPSLTELETDTSAQIVYAKSVAATQTA